MQQSRRSRNQRQKSTKTQRVWSLEGFYMDGKHLWELFVDRFGNTRRRKA